MILDEDNNNNNCYTTTTTMTTGKEDLYAPCLYPWPGF